MLSLSCDRLYDHHQDTNSNQTIKNDKGLEISSDILGFRMDQIFENKRKRRHGVHLKRQNQSSGLQIIF